MGPIVAILQTGAPTPVINRTLAAAVNVARDRQVPCFGFMSGWLGMSGMKLRPLNQQAADFALTGAQIRNGQLPEFDIIKLTPGAFLGAERFAITNENAGGIVERLATTGITHVVAIGGDSTIGVLQQLAKEAEERNFGIVFVHVPKTIDNDVGMQYAAPGFASAAKCVAETIHRIDLDMKSTARRIFMQITMGRWAGWLAAASALAKTRIESGPHLIYVPEVNFTIDKFIRDIRTTIERHGMAFIVIGEGINTKANGATKTMVEVACEFFNASVPVEKVIGGTDFTSGIGLLAEHLKAKIVESDEFIIPKDVRWEMIGYGARSAPQAKLDIEIAEKAGRTAVEHALKAKENFSIVITNGGSLLAPELEYNFVPLETAAKAGKKFMPPDYISEEGNYVTPLCAQYVYGLTGPLEFEAWNETPLLLKD